MFAEPMLFGRYPFDLAPLLDPVVQAGDLATIRQPLDFYGVTLWQISHDNPYILGDLTWTAMDYLGESGIGAWQYGTPQQAKMAEGLSGMMSGTAMIDQLFTGMANGKDVMADMANNNSDPNAKAMMEFFFHPYPWHAAACGDLDLTGLRKPQSYYRDIVWNGGDRVYATVRLPEPEGKKIIAIMWATYPTLTTWTWPGRKARNSKSRSIPARTKCSFS